MDTLAPDIATRVKITRGFVDTSQGQVHYRVAGAGKPLILLHPSPFSSRRYGPLMPLLALRRRVYAVDNPGYGESFRPASQPKMEDYADFMAEIIAGLGYDKVPLYGDLTGAIIALATAVHHPERVSALALGVIPYFGGHLEEVGRWRAMYPIAFQLDTPPADGSHFRAMYRRLVDNRIHESVPGKRTISPEQVTEWVIERMQMGDAAPWGFEAVFHCEMDAGLRGITCPILIPMTESHGNETQIARAKAILPKFELRNGPNSFLIEEVADFLSTAIPDFLDERGL